MICFRSVFLRLFVLVTFFNFREFFRFFFQFNCLLNFILNWDSATDLNSTLKKKDHVFRRFLDFVTLWLNHKSLLIYEEENWYCLLWNFFLNVIINNKLEIYCFLLYFWVGPGGAPKNFQLEYLKHERGKTVLFKKICAI